MNILPVASGKGGVGKSTIASNLAVILAQKGKKTVLVDLDLGGANLHTLLGLKNNHAGLGNFIYRQASDLVPLLQDTGVQNLSFIAGDCLFPGTTNLNFFVKKRIIRLLNALDADYVMLDLGAGATIDTLDFFLTTYNSLIVITPEITSILNAYSFLKAAAYRFFTCQFAAKSEERASIKKYIEESNQGSESTFSALIAKICNDFPETSKHALSELNKCRPQIILNQGHSVRDLELTRRLRSLIYSRLGIQVDFVGCIQKDDAIPLSIVARKPLVISSPNGSFSKQLDAAADRILFHTYAYNADMFEYDELPVGAPDVHIKKSSKNNTDEISDEFVC